MIIFFSIDVIFTVLYFPTLLSLLHYVNFSQLLSEYDEISWWSMWKGEKQTRKIHICRKCLGPGSTVPGA